MLDRNAPNRELCPGFAFVVLTIALAMGFVACSFDSSGLTRLEDDVFQIGGGDADAFDPEIRNTDVRDASTDIATDAGSDAEVRDTSDIDDTVAADAQDGEILSDATLDSDEIGDDVEVGMDVEVGDTMDADVLDAGSDAPTDVVIEDVTTDAPAEIEGDTELDSEVTSDTRDASADIFDAMDAEAEVFDTVDAEEEVDERCERDRDCGFGQICWMGECLDNQTCNPFAVISTAGTWLTWYPSSGPSVSERASGSTVWDESPPGACSVAVEASSCQCLTHFGASSCGALPAGGWGCVHNDDHIP